MKVPLSPGMAAIVRSKLATPRLIRACLFEAHRFTAKEALEAGMIDEAVAEEHVLDTAIALAEKWAPYAPAGPAMSMIKEEMYPEAVQALTHGGIGHIAKIKF
jgi:enoyl-CoA hydratase/carnithine racemase